MKRRDIVGLFFTLLSLSCQFTLVELSISLGRCDLSCSEGADIHPTPVGESSRVFRGKAGPTGPKGNRGPPGDVGSPGRDCDCLKYEEDLAKLESREYRYVDCKRVKGAVSTSGISVIFPFANEPGIHAYCDQVTDGGGWIVIQRRVGGTETFYRGWNDYVVGFGSKETDFWMGLEIIHKLVRNGTWELRVDLVDHDENRAFAKYRSFSIAGSSDNYRLSVSGHQGTAGDSLGSTHNGRQFTTIDRDNDLHSTGNCAQGHEGGWWYNKCHSSNLNGRYNASESSADGVTWHPWHKTHVSLKRAEMKIRRVE